jgi:hypothetical protein
MKTRMMRKIAVLVTGSALALSFPVAGAIAGPGGVPHPGSQGKGKQEKQHTNKGKHKGKQQKQNGPNGPNGSSRCPDPFPGQGNQRDRGTLPTEQARDNGQKCGFTGGFSNSTN